MSLTLQATVVVTVRNERASIESFLDRLLQQTQRPSEIVVVDGQSNAGTYEIPQRHVGEYLVKVILRDCNIAQGRNIGIDAATCGLVPDCRRGYWGYWIFHAGSDMLFHRGDIRSGKGIRLRLVRERPDADVSSPQSGRPMRRTGSGSRSGRRIHDSLPLQRTKPYGPMADSCTNGSMPCASPGARSDTQL